MKHLHLTAFEIKVLKATLRIPLGRRRSYAWVAKAVGRPKAVRAVGRALHKNPFPLLVPCHRVVKKDGSLGGFAKGLKTKKALLDLEQEIARLFKGARGKSPL